MSSRTTPKVCIIGAGFAGLCAAIQLKKQLGLDTFTIFESNHEIGGTWLTNTYPGCACDIQSHLYSFSFDRNPYWSSNYAPQPEIWKYMQDVANKYELYPRIQFSTKVTLIQWNEKVNKWKVTTTKDSGQEMESEYDIVINGSGAIRIPNYPEEFKNFKGPTIHSAGWNSDINLDNKVVGLIGSGASAIQVVPAIAPKVKQLFVFQRRAPYVDGRMQFKYPRFVQMMFALVPFLMLVFRTLIYIAQDLFVWAFKSGHWLNKMSQEKSIKNMKSMLKDAKIQGDMVPKYKFGCKRVTFSESYYKTLNLSHVTLNTNEIIRVNDASITTKDGDTQKIDVLILCTGFKVQNFFAPMQMIGRNGSDILDLWSKNIPPTYYGITCNLAPNNFFILGPNTLLGHNSVLFMIECQVNFVVQVIGEMMRRNAVVAEVKMSAQNKFMKEATSGLSQTIWVSENCGSWYENDRGEITSLWPESCTSYWRKTRKVDFSLFDWK